VIVRQQAQRGQNVAHSGNGVLGGLHRQVCAMFVQALVDTAPRGAAARADKAVVQNGEQPGPQHPIGAPLGPALARSRQSCIRSSAAFSSRHSAQA